ncbi:MAG: cupredoxin domain-containing protein [bacterium]|nr:cupredoxin domain-containing protein [bacterium]MDZ4295936.1 cupredoxin domain-containing protein [Patescibacteria group bacterium]
MNKYAILILIGAFIVGGGIVYRNFLLPERLVPVTTGKTREVTIIAEKDEWRFTPETIEAERGDKIIATIINEDDYDHGIAIDAFGISQRMPALSTIKVEFVVTQEGEFPFYCSVPCGEGVVDGVRRTHFDMIGKIHVRSVITDIK